MQVDSLPSGYGAEPTAMDFKSEDADELDAYRDDIDAVPLLVR